MDGSGNLAIRALNNNGQYTSARLKTQGKFDFTYGKVDVRAKVPYGKGIWPAIWMLGNDIDKVGWPKSGEIDIMEYIGPEDTATIYGTVHGPTASGTHTSAGSSIKAPDDKTWYDDFHVYSLEWTPDSMRILVDGSKYLDVPAKDTPNGLQWVFQHPFFLLLNVAVGGNWPGYPDSSTQFPATLLVDYVHVYQRQ
jgi:beta-glucanase (GH16 family)